MLQDRMPFPYYSDVDGRFKEVDTMPCVDTSGIILICERGEFPLCTAPTGTVTNVICADFVAWRTYEDAWVFQEVDGSNLRH